MIYLLIKFVTKKQMQQNVEKMAKCGDFFSGARGNAKLMINFSCLIPVQSYRVSEPRLPILVSTPIECHLEGMGLDKESTLDRRG